MSNATPKAPSVLPGFTATPELCDAFQRALVDVTALSLISKQIHWNVVGPNLSDSRSRSPTGRQRPARC